MIRVSGTTSKTPPHLSIAPDPPTPNRLGPFPPSYHAAAPLLNQGHPLSPIYYFQMNRYKVLAEIGTGTYGKVLRARRRVDGLVVAVKALKKAEVALSCEGILRTREVEALKQLQHPSIIRLIEVCEHG